ncbi:asparagine synthase-related protein [Sphingobium sp.]|uniref:asparagine synthase-related protein n=1 Tax=Sphingobium sp. TaxID=1912891 RepID=UPI003B3AA19B
MYRFIALCGDLDAEDGLPDIGLAQRHDGRHLRIYAEPAMPCTTTPDGRGIVLGHIFDRPCGFAVTSFDQAVSARIVETRGQALIDGFWGGYLALIDRDGASGWVALRDPSGAFPCYHLKRGKLMVFASDPHILVLARLLPPKPDWQNLFAHLRSADLRSERTCIAGLDELLPGRRMGLAHSASSDACWSPWQDFTCSAWTDSRDKNSEILERIVRNCVTSWASCFDSIKLGVSGGLDSSIVATCLAPLGKSLSLYTMVASGGDGDEREFAHILGDALNLPVAEEHYDLSGIDIRTTTSSTLPRPVGGGFFLQEIARACRDTPQKRPVDAHFTGTGGDNVFCYLQSSRPFVDRLLRDGLGGALNSLRDLSVMTGASMPAIALNGLAKWPPWRRSYRWQEDRSFLNDVIAESAPFQADHPWLDRPRDGLPGKALHIVLLLRIQNYLEQHFLEGVPRKVAPLISQPIMEYCLSLPSWLWCKGGKNRSLARQAFARHLPAKITSRTAKGGPDSFSLSLFDHYRATIRACLLDGAMAAEGLLDRAMIESALDPRNSIGATAKLRILALADAEAWAQGWISRQPDAL